ncbi:PadR family transcriptional regulator [Candidatus Nitrosotenuis chungbukensis]|uniref:PadR family transcriptional regulator n=1 Tax=Candidatus Nitrosotenuis chungbukensis TaxID=1353246 RepID=UPI002673EC29|nr:PadR family transcriptional regulator [Candidatus Nitrosotenuis chungbukensis]WKT58201.1 PadR family transcriptional regulator [Candidatus Nitrosotenuis chungbukensis]
MVGEWLQRVGSSIPRGFSRYFILELLTTKPYTGKEIIDAATQQSDGKWKPSPGLIYPLLGRLLDEGLIEESKDGKYQITKKGKDTSDDLQTVNKIIKNQLDVLLRIGNVGRFATMDVLERMNMLGSSLGSNVIKMTKEETQKYRKFLESELKKLDASEGKQGKEIKID